MVRIERKETEMKTKTKEYYAISPQFENLLANVIIALIREEPIDGSPELRPWLTVSAAEIVVSLEKAGHKKGHKDCAMCDIKLFVDKWASKKLD